MLFDASVAERAREVRTSASTLYRRLGRFAEDGMESLFDAPKAKRRGLPPAVRRLIVDLKAEHPAFNLNEIANVVHAAFGREPDVRSVGRVLSGEPLPLIDGEALPALPRNRRPESAPRTSFTWSQPSPTIASWKAMTSGCSPLRPPTRTDRCSSQAPRFAPRG
jgi:hypothetical protein